MDGSRSWENAEVRSLPSWDVISAKWSRRSVVLTRLSWVLSHVQKRQGVLLPQVRSFSLQQRPCVQTQRRPLHLDPAQKRHRVPFLNLHFWPGLAHRVKAARLKALSAMKERLSPAVPSGSRALLEAGLSRLG